MINDGGFESCNLTSGFRSLAFSTQSTTSSDKSLIPLYRLQCTASRASAVAHHQNAGSGHHVSAARAIPRTSFVLVAILHDALVACPDGAGQGFAGLGGGDGAALPHLLVSALCVCAATGTQLARRAGPHPGVFFAAAGKGISPCGGGGKGALPHLPARRAPAVSRQ